MFQIQNVFVDVWEMHSMPEVRKWNQIYISLGWSFKASEIVSVWSFSCRLMIFQNRILNHLYVVWDIHEHYTEKKREKSNHYVENKHARMLFPWCILEHILMFEHCSHIPFWYYIPQISANFYFGVLCWLLILLSSTKKVNFQVH